MFTEHIRRISMLRNANTKHDLADEVAKWLGLKKNSSCESGCL